MSKFITTKMVENWLSSQKINYVELATKKKGKELDQVMVEIYTGVSGDTLGHFTAYDWSTIASVIEAKSGQPIRTQVRTGQIDTTGAYQYIVDNYGKEEADAYAKGASEANMVTPLTIATIIVIAGVYVYRFIRDHRAKNLVWGLAGVALALLVFYICLTLQLNIYLSAIIAVMAGIIIKPLVGVISNFFTEKAIYA